jgi:hypothetical protein
MASDKDIKINIKTYADTKGAKDAKNAIDENKKALQEWQAELNKSIKDKGGSSGLAVDPTEMNQAKAAADQMGDAVQNSAVAAAGSIEALENELKKLESQLRKIPVGSAAFIDMAKKVDLAKQSLNTARTTALVTYSRELQNVQNNGRRMGNVMQNAGYQVADVAVQLEMGTSAARAFTQQGSQLLGVLGPWGAVAGAALAIGGAVFSATQETKDQKEAVDSLEETYRRLIQAEKDAATALNIESIQKGTKAYEARKDQIQGILGFLSRQIAFEKQLLDIETGRQDAEAAFAIKQIEGSDMDEESKLLNISKIRKDSAEKKRQADLADIEMENKKATLARIAAVAEMEKADQTVERQGGIANDAQKRNDLASDKLNRLKDRSAVIDEEIANQEKKVAPQKVAKYLGFPNTHAEEKATLEALKNEKKYIPKVIAEIEEDLKNASSESATDALIKAEEDLAKAREAAAKAAQEEAYALALAESKKKTINSQKDISLGGADIDLRVGTKKAQEQSAKEAREKQIQQAEAELNRQQSLIPGSQLRASSQLKNAGLGVQNPNAQALRDTLLGASETLSKGADEKELLKLANDFKSLTVNMSGTKIEFLKQIIAAQNTAVQEINNLKGQVKNLRDNK